MSRRATPLVLALAAALLGGCGGTKTVCTPGGPLSVAALPPDWRDAITDADHVKLRKLRAAFLDGLAQARAKGFGAQVDAEGLLFDPDSPRDGAPLASGDYRCRTFSLGSKVDGRPAYVVAPARTCRIAADGRLQTLIEQDGPQRLSGRIYPDEEARTVFLGTRVLADEARPLHYSRDQDRDTVGAIQRVDRTRWRLAIPYPAWDATIQVVEIVAAG